MLFDTHAHLDSPEFADDLAGVVESAMGSGVSRILTVATDLASSYRSIRISETWESVHAAIGIHPNHCQDASPAEWQEIAGLHAHPRVVALGETGLDKHWDFCPFPLQVEYFERHIRLSHDSGLPFVVHMRDCEPEMLETLSRLTDQGRLNGIMHSFCGSQEAVERCLDWGMMISFAGMVTYPKNGELREVARRVPEDRLLVETDSPWLSPHPVRKMRPNTPALVRHTLECLAASRGVDPLDLAQATTDNAMRLFRLDPEPGSQRPSQPCPLPEPDAP